MSASSPPNLRPNKRKPSNSPYDNDKNNSTNNNNNNTSNTTTTNKEQLHFGSVQYKYLQLGRMSHCVHLAWHNNM